VGKWHLATLEDASPAGPMDHWPLQRGFDRYYGFMGGATDQYSPELTIDNHPIDPPNEPGYHVSEDIVDQMISMITAHSTARSRSLVTGGRGAPGGRTLSAARRAQELLAVIGTTARRAPRWRAKAFR